jgi:hypothetical protein
MKETTMSQGIVARPRRCEMGSCMRARVGYYFEKRAKL